MDEFFHFDCNFVLLIKDNEDISCATNAIDIAFLTTKKYICSMRSHFKTWKYITQISIQGFEFECHAFESASARTFRGTVQLKRKSCNDDKINKKPI